MITTLTTVYPWCDGHSTNISASEVWGEMVEIQVSKREFSYTYTLKLG